MFVVALVFTFVIVITSAGNADANEAGTAPASEQRSAELGHVMAAGASAGVGTSDRGSSGRAGLELEYFPWKNVGFGVQGFAAGHLRVLVSSGHVLAAGPVLVLRSAPRRSYCVASAGAGLARVEHGESQTLCLSNCSEPRTEEYVGLTVSASIGYLMRARDSSLEFGPVLRFDAERDWTGRYQGWNSLTLNLRMAALFSG